MGGAPATAQDHYQAACRGVSEMVVPSSEEAAAELFAKIRVGEGPEVDGFEATRILEQLGQADVDDVVTGAGAFRVLVRVPGGITAHVLRMPSAEDVIEYRRTFARIFDLPFNKQELTVNLGAAGTLYQKLCQSTEGYVGAVPIIHQAVAVKAAIDALEAGFQEDRPSLRFLIYGALRRKKLCDVNLCPDSSDDGSRCEKCPLNRLDATHHSEAGQLLRRALNLRAAIKMGIVLGLDEISADEFYAMLAIEEAQS